MRISSVRKRKKGGRGPWSQTMESVEENLPWHGWAKYVSKMYQKYVSPLYRTDTRVLYAANSQIQRPPSEFFQCTRKACHNTVELNVCIMGVITELHIFKSVMASNTTRLHPKTKQFSLDLSCSQLVFWKPSYTKSTWTNLYHQNKYFTKMRMKAVFLWVPKMSNFFLILNCLFVCVD